MKHMETFQPKWTTPPGATVHDLLEERGMPLDVFADATRKDLRSVTRLICGVEPLTDGWAQSLSQVLGATPKFWLQREALYRSDLERLVQSHPGGGLDDWLKELPLKDMVQFGWIEKGKTTLETATNACAFFGATTSEAFERKYRSLLASSAYSKTTAYSAKPSADAAWLRQGEVVAATVSCAPWSESRLRDSLDSIRTLTLERDPSKFLPSLERLLARAGVALAVVRAPTGCRASGVARFLHPKRALIQLSFRYLSDDQFWFTVFHEIGHILLHAHDEMFLEGLEDRHSDAEVEADRFAVATLFSRVGVDALDHVELSKFAIARLARRAGVAPGIVVGQLQQRGRIPYSHFNYMKARYTWGE